MIGNRKQNLYPATCTKPPTRDCFRIFSIKELTEQGKLVGVAPWTPQVRTTGPSSSGHATKPHGDAGCGGRGVGDTPAQKWHNDRLFRLFRVRELAGKGCSASDPHH